MLKVIAEDFIKTRMYRNRSSALPRAGSGHDGFTPWGMFALTYS